MDKDQAINIVKQVASTYRGTPEEHQTIATAIATIEDELKALKSHKKP